jgi:hypothetical protein
VPIVVTVVAVIAVAGLVAAVVAVRRDADPAAPPPAQADDLDPVVAEIAAFVEEERGLTFEEPVEVELADDAEFERRLLEDLDESRDELAESELVFQALGLIEPDADLLAAFEESLAGGVIGFYDPETDELVVRGTDTGPYVRTTIAHELTHALDDQHFDLDRPEIDESDGEEGFGFSALVEGSAVRVEERYLASLSPEDQATYAEAEAEIAEDFPVFSVPRVVLEMLVAPYALGPVLVDHVIDEGGQRAFDAAFAEPPVTSEQVLEPERFTEDEGPVAVTPPVGAGTVASDGAFGAFLLQLMLGEELDPPETRDAVDGWGGDAYVAWADGDRACVRVSVVGDSAADTDELAEAIESWMDAVGGGDVSTAAAGGPVTFTRCG